MATDPTPKRIKHNIYMREDLFEEARNAAAWLAGGPTFLDLGRLFDSAIERELVRLRKKHNDGKAFPARPGQLRGGRRSEIS